MKLKILMRKKILEKSVNKYLLYIYTKIKNKKKNFFKKLL